ncbi:MAG: hypothetical protein F4Z10_06805 [Synechococcus sp. SB0666_bin_14]|nr:hypothetical protein [Synechococcus sp. SB0666_bin_14]MYG47292.1 hypothetical protein [Synechococcus sp. SB0675_bin_6]MYJ60188.1 hypothetical protein [Synechococcus sp. SB0672_bin_6]MYK92238.1 hypothetical protein [Synechococcus sp. SB0669_bin_8]
MTKAKQTQGSWACLNPAPVNPLVGGDNFPARTSEGEETLNTVQPPGSGPLKGKIHLSEDFDAQLTFAELSLI